MALTQWQKPQNYTPAYNNQFITYKSDQYATSGFSYLVEVSVNGVLVNTYKELPRPDGFMVFNAMEAVKNHIERSFDPTSVVVLEDVNKAINIDVVISENGISPIDTDTFSYVAWDACLTDSDFRAFNPDNYVFDGATVKILSDSVTDFLSPDDRVTVNTDLWIHFFRNNTDNVVLTVYDENSVLQSTITLAIPAADLICYVNIGATTLKAQSPPVIPLPGWRVEVAIVDGVSTVFESSYSYSEICTKNEILRLYYLNRQGSIRHMTFEKRSDETRSLKKNTVRLNPNTLNTTTGIYGAPAYKREVHDVSSQSEKKLSLNTNWITEDQSLKLLDLFDSPIIWLNNESGDYTPVSNADLSYTVQKHVNEKLFLYTINLDNVGIYETRQRGI